MKSVIKGVATTAGIRRAQRRNHNRELLLVWGNCQAEPLRRLLASSALADSLALVSLPPVHTVTPPQLAAVKGLLGRARVVVTQPVRNDYRGMPTGTEQILACAPSAKVIRFPSMYYGGLHPYLVYVHASGDLGTPAPMTAGYHDLRFIAAAAKGVSDVEEWLESYRIDADAIRNLASDSARDLAERERNLDVTIASLIAPPLGGDGSFWTVNHPSNKILLDVARQVCEALGHEGRVSTAPRDELLSDVIAPVHREVLEALDLERRHSTPRWIVQGRSSSDAAVMRAHLAYYKRHPDVLQHAAKEHAPILEQLGLL